VSTASLTPVRLESGKGMAMVTLQVYTLPSFFSSSEAATWGR